MSKPPFICLFCGARDTFNRAEHPIPESLGNDDTVLPPGFVCDSCNEYFGIKVEKDVLSQPIFGIERTAAAVKTKRGKLAKYADGRVALFASGAWGHVILAAPSPEIVSVGHNQSCLVLPRLVSSQVIMLSRFFLKVGLELLLLSNVDAYGNAFSRARNHARYGLQGIRWEVAYGLYPNRSALLLSQREDEHGPLEPHQLYQYEIGAMHDGDIILMFVFVNHCFACNLSRPAIGGYLRAFNAMNCFEIRLLSDT